MRGLETVFMNFRMPESRYDEVGVRRAVEQLLVDALSALAIAYACPRDSVGSTPDGADVGLQVTDASQWRIDFVLSVVYEYEIVFIELCTADEVLAEAFGAVVDTETERMLSAGQLSPIGLLTRTASDADGPVLRLGTMVPYRFECGGAGASLQCLLDGDWRLKEPIEVTDVLVALGFVSNGRTLQLELGSPADLPVRERRLLERLAVSRSNGPDFDLPLLLEFDGSNPRAWRLNEQRRSA